MTLQIHDSEFNDASPPQRIRNGSLQDRFDTLRPMFLRSLEMMLPALPP